MEDLARMGWLAMSFAFATLGVYLIVTSLRDAFLYWKSRK